MSLPISYLERGQGSETLVLLHGIGGQAASWEPQLRAFARDYRVLAWDMPGYGDSALLSQTTISTLADALAQWLDERAAQNIHLLGHSIGGMIAQAFVSRYPKRLKTLILYATSAAFGRTDGDWQAQFLHARLSPLQHGKAMAELASELIPPLLAANSAPSVIQRAIGSMAVVPADTYRAMLQAIVGFDLRHDLARIPVKTLVLAGEHDINAPAPMMAKMASKIPNAVYDCLSGAGHLGHLEQPHAFNTAVTAFLKC